MRTILSRKTLKTGEVKQMTMISPIGMRGMAARQAKLAVEMVNPKRPMNMYRSSLFDFGPRIFKDLLCSFS